MNVCIVIRAHGLCADLCLVQRALILMAMNDGPILASNEYPVQSALGQKLGAEIAMEHDKFARRALPTFDGLKLLVSERGRLRCRFWGARLVHRPRPV